MNLNDRITLAKIMRDINNDHIQDKATYIIRYGHLKNFIDCYLAHLGLTDVELATAFKKKPMNLNLEFGKDLNINDYVDGDILITPKWLCFRGRT